MFSSINNALQYIKENLSRFFLMPGEFATRKIRIDKAKEDAQKQNDQVALGKLILAQSQLDASRREYDALVLKLGPFKDFLASWSLSAIPPIWIGASAVAVATALYAFFNKFQNEGKALDLIRAGLMTPKEAQALLQGGGVTDTISKVNTMAIIALVAFALFTFGPEIKKRLA